MHMRWPLLIVLLAATGCDSTTPRYMGVARGEITIAGSDFVVFRRGLEVEAYRVSREDRPSEQGVLLRAGFAMEALTGCEIAPGSMTGDQAIVRATLKCNDLPRAVPGAMFEIRGATATCVTVETRPFPKDWLPASETDCLIEAFPLWPYF